MRIHAMPCPKLPVVALTIGLFAPLASADQPAADAPAIDRLNIDRIYNGSEFNSKSFSGRWLDGQSAYTTLRSSDGPEGGNDIIHHDAASGDETVMVASSELIPPESKSPLSIADYAWSSDKNLLLIFTNTKRVWRKNTRGDYWLLDRTSRQLRQVGVNAPPSSLMFAKISPTGDQVAYVSEQNLYVEDILGRNVRKLTNSDSKHIINGTTDWVYEEELGVRDGFRWSPDGRAIAYWQINTEGVPEFPLINQTDSLYPTVKWFAYPKVGQQNPACRIGLVDCDSAETNWIDLPGDPREHYVPRVQFLPSSRSEGDSPRLLIQQLNRLQNRNRLFLADFRSHTVSPVLDERDDAWVDVHDETMWLEDGRFFTWISERDGWRHIYVASLDDGSLRQVTDGAFDVIELLHVDEANEVLYFIASPKSASERYLYRIALDGSGRQRVTPNGFLGTHSYKISSDAQWAIHSRSSADTPPRSQLIRTMDHSVVRVLEDNQQLAEKLGSLSTCDTEFFRISVGDDVELDGWCILPPDLQEDQQYPLLVYVYGEPAGTTVVNRWGGKSALWHRMLAEQGYVVMSFDNRGTKAPRGRSWRKSIYKKIGILPPADQAAAVRAVLASRPYLDPKRIGVWGWSGGGSSSLHAIFKHPDLYSTAMVVAPVPNQRYYDTIYQERYMSLPGLNVEGFREGSPINFAKNLKGNLLLVHGSADDNCHYQTTEMLVNELIAHNKQFRLMVYPNRTHSVSEGKNTTRHLRTLMTDYLHQHLPAGN